MSNFRGVTLYNARWKGGQKSRRFRRHLLWMIPNHTSLNVQIISYMKPKFVDLFQTHQNLFKVIRSFKSHLYVLSILLKARHLEEIHPLLPFAHFLPLKCKLFRVCWATTMHNKTGYNIAAQNNNSLTKHVMHLLQNFFILNMNY